MINIFRYGTDDISSIFSRSQLDNAAVNDSVSEIISAVRRDGDKALFDYALRFDGIKLDECTLRVTEQEIQAAYAEVDKKLLESLRRAKNNVLKYHVKQAEALSAGELRAEGAVTGWRYAPVARAGVYVPGGTASYPSSVLMCVLPAVAAGVKEIAVVTPNISNPLTLVAMSECGVTEIYKTGGAQAIAALAYGTQSIKKVNVIAGPGNIYVTQAKKQVFGHVAVDMIAGPSEILVIADSTARPDYIAADMLSQAEHDVNSASILVTTDNQIAKRTAEQLQIQLASLPRSGIAERSLLSNGAIIVVDSISDAVKISDEIAPEHLEIITADAASVADKITNAGAVFIGGYSPEPLGDYFAGPSHCLPTSGTAKHFQVLSVSTFVKRISYINYESGALKSVKDDVIAIAESEGLTAHANAIRIRFEK